VKKLVCRISIMKLGMSVTTNGVFLAAVIIIDLLGKVNVKLLLCLSHMPL
jgi:hypothetical protein